MVCDGGLLFPVITWSALPLRMRYAQSVPNMGMPFYQGLGRIGVPRKDRLARTCGQTVPQRASGSQTEKVVPLPGALCTSMLPP